MIARSGRILAAMPSLWWIALLVGVIAILVASAILAPIVGIRRAVRRLERRQRSKGAVAWSGINVVVFGFLTIGGISMGAFHPIAAAGLVLNGLWLMAAVRANRGAGARPTPDGSTKQA